MRELCIEVAHAAREISACSANGWLGEAAQRADFYPEGLVRAVRYRGTHTRTWRSVGLVANIHCVKCPGREPGHNCASI